MRDPSLRLLLDGFTRSFFGPRSLRNFLRRAVVGFVKFGVAAVVRSRGVLVDRVRRLTSAATDPDLLGRWVALLYRVIVVGLLGKTPEFR